MLQWEGNILISPLFLPIQTLQVANDGYTAFDKAHTNMDKIRLETLEIPKSLKKALTILFKVYNVFCNNIVRLLEKLT